MGVFGYRRVCDHLSSSPIPSAPAQLAKEDEKRRELDRGCDWSAMKAAELAITAIDAKCHVEEVDDEVVKDSFASWCDAATALGM